MLSAYRNLCRLVAAVGLVLIGTEEDYEYGTSRTFSQKVSRRQLFHDFIDARWTKTEEQLLRLIEFKTLDEFVEAMIDVYDSDGFYPQALLTPEAAEDKRKDAERRRLEREASELAQRYNAAPGSFEFIKACHQELERLSSYREGLREDGLCIGYGVTYEQWSDEYNSSQGDSSNVHEILSWLESECPLLMAKYRETELGG